MKRKKRKNSGDIPAGAHKCTNCNGVGYRYEKIKDLSGRSGSGIADTFRVVCEGCNGKGYVTKKESEDRYTQMMEWGRKRNPRRYRRNSKCWSAKRVASRLRRPSHKRFASIIRKLRKSRRKRSRR